MSETTGHIPFVGDPQILPLTGDGLHLERRADGSVHARRLRAGGPQLYLAVVADGVVWGTRLGDLVRALARRGEAIAPHHGTVLAFLRGDDVASAPTTFYEGIQRLRAGDEVTVGPDGTCDRARPEPPAPAASLPLASALRSAVREALGDAGASPVVLLGEDLGSAALLGAVEGPAAAVRVRAGSTRVQDAGSEVEGPSRAVAAARAADADLRTVRPTTDQFKKDLGDLVRTQAEPFAGLGVYAHYCAVRDAARDGSGAVLLDAGGPLGSGLIDLSRPAEDPRPADGLLGTLRERVRGHTRRHLGADMLLARPFLEETAATGQLAARPQAARDTGAVVAAQRNAARFGVPLCLPLVDPRVASALARSADVAGPEGLDASGPLVALAPLAAPAAAGTRPERRAPIDQHEWLSRLKGTLHQVFRSEQFATRPWADQRATLEAFEEHVAGRVTGGDDVFWRLLSVELWMRECVDDPLRETTGSAGDTWQGEDDHGRFDEPEPKAALAPNAGKRLDLEVRGDGAPVMARRYPLQTGKFAVDSDMDAEVARYVGSFFTALETELAGDGPEAEDHRAATVGRPWNLTISEKIIAIMQGRSYFVWDVKPSWWARSLSGYVARTPAGIGLGDPVTMQLAIQEAGLPRVLAASVAGAAGKVLRRKGWFYHVVGGNVRAIDGPTEYSVYPANVSAKLPPKDPDAVAAHLNEVVRAAVPEAWRPTFTGTVVMDANDIGRNTLGQAAPRSARHYELQFADNPLGQGREQTPMAIVFER